LPVFTYWMQSPSLLNSPPFLPNVHSEPPAFAPILLLGHRERKGYPEGALQVVHDSARVFRIFDDELFMRLRLDIETDLPIRRIARSL